MQDLCKQGVIKAIGVSNFYPDRLVDLIDYNEVTEMTRVASTCLTSGKPVVCGAVAVAAACAVVNPCGLARVPVWADRSAVISRPLGSSTRCSSRSPAATPAR